MFVLLYSVLAFLLYLTALPLLFILSFKDKYRHSIPSRFWLKNNPPLKPGGVWFHVCSFGEARAIKTLVETIDLELRRCSAITQTGYKEICSYTPRQSRYLVFEPLLWFWMRPQKALIVFEAELWYLLFAIAKRKGARTALVNARISDRSFRRYKRFAWLYKYTFKHIDRVFAQTELDRKRLLELGAKEIEVTGNIKLATLPRPTRRYKKPSNLTVCAASTHEGEEALMVQAFLALKVLRPEAVLFLVPRHPERFDTVAKAVQRFARQHALEVRRFSRHGVVKSDIVLVDALGELINFYAISDIVIMGGSFVSAGGHNAAEAAQFGCKIISGTHTFNQRDIYRAVEGIVTVERDRLQKALLDYESLPATRIKQGVRLDPILEWIAKSSKEDING